MYLLSWQLENPFEVSEIGARGRHVKAAWLDDGEERKGKEGTCNKFSLALLAPIRFKEQKHVHFFIDAVIKFASNRRLSHSHLSGLSPASLVSTLSIIVILICPPSLSVVTILINQQQ